MFNVLVEFEIAEKQSVNLIMKNPLNMLYDNLFELLSDKFFRDGVYVLINAIFKSGKDPTEFVRKLL